MKDYSLILRRPINPETVRIDDPVMIAGTHGFVPARYIDGPWGENKEHVVETEDGELHIMDAQKLFERPMCWLEGKPIYRGDTVYSTLDGAPFVVQGVDRDNPFVLISNAGLRLASPLVAHEPNEGCCKPLEGWVALDKIYSHGTPETYGQVRPRPFVFRKEEDARLAYPDAIICRIEWSETHKPEFVDLPLRASRSERNY